MKIHGAACPKGSHPLVIGSDPPPLYAYNRYEMFRASLDHLPEWDAVEAGEANHLALLGSDGGERIQAFLDPEGSDYSLVKEIVGQSEMLGGHRPVSELAEHKLREFVDRVLVQEHVPDLLLSMPDGSRRRRASLLLADAIEILAGNGSPIRYDRPVPRMTAESSQTLREMAARLAADPESNPNQNLPEHPLSIEEAI